MFRGLALGHAELSALPSRAGGVALQRRCRASTLAGVSGAQVEDLVGAAGQPGHDLGDPGGGSVGPFAWVPADLS